MSAYINSIQSAQAKVEDYLAIAKFKVVLMLTLTALVGVILAPDSHRLFHQQVFSLIGIMCISASAAVINHMLDSRIDSMMARTKARPVATNRISLQAACSFAMLLALTGVGLLLNFANVLCLVLTLASLFVYAIVYTVVLKHCTPQNIVIGGVAGAMPPLLGWVSETGQLSAEPWLLVMIIFTWTPPHFWALAIAKRKDYERAGVPMLPVTHGVSFTKLCILAYTVLLSLVCVFPFLIGMSGYFYLYSAVLLNGLFIAYAVRLMFYDSNQLAMSVFYFSIWHLLILFAALMIDSVIT